MGFGEEVTILDQSSETSICRKYNEDSKISKDRLWNCEQSHVYKMQIRGERKTLDF